MTVFGGKNRRYLREVSLVIQNEAAFSTKWVLKQVLAAVEAAQGPACNVSVFILEDSPEEDLEYLADIAFFRKFSSDASTWVPEVLHGSPAPDAVVVAGIQANEDFSRALKFPLIYLPILLDRVDEPPLFFPENSEFLDMVAKKANTVFFSTERARSNAETVAPSLCERTRIFGPSETDLPKHLYSEGANQAVELLQTVSSLTANVNSLLAKVGEDFRELRQPPVSTIVGTTHEEKLFIEGSFGDVRFLPGVEFRNQGFEPAYSHQPVMVLDDTGDSASEVWRLQEAFEAHILPLALSRIEPWVLVRALSLGEPVPAEWVVRRSSSGVGQGLTPGIQEALEPNELSTDTVTRVVLAGKDFKFGSLIVRELESASDIEFVLDHSKVGRKQSAVLAEWADVVLTEFLTPHTVWYSKNLPIGTRLIVHMHGYELYKPLVHDLNINGVHRVVVPSEAYRQKVLKKMKWPERLVQVIHNGGSVHDLSREKDQEARFRLGMVGWVPSLKRIDRALDLLERLIQVDSRYMLEVRGAFPWNYRYEWDTPAHRDMHMEMLNQLRRKPGLADHITFAPFGPDVGNWLRGIGWMLSPSVRESFHLAPVEGMISGAVPIVWQREGASDVYDEQWIHTDSSDAADYIIRTNSNAYGWTALSHRAHEEALNQYDESKLRAAWHELIVLPAVEKDQDCPIGESQLRSLGTAEQKALHGDFQGAWDEIQLRGNELIHVSRERGISFDAWVQGHIRLPHLILSTQFQLNQPRAVASEGNDSFVHIKTAALGREVGQGMYGAVRTVLLAPPVGSHEFEDFIPSHFAAFEPLVPLLGRSPHTRAPLDEYIEDTSKQLVKLAAQFGAQDFKIDGPYWAVLAALQATTETGGRVVWDLTQHLTKNVVSFRSFIHGISDNAVEFASRVIADHVDRVIISASEPIPQAIMEMFSTDQIEIETVETSGFASRRTSQVSVKDFGQLQDLPKISVIVTTYKMDDFLFETLDSLTSQSYPLNKVEVLIVFCGQSPADRGIIDQYLDRLREADWRILESPAGVASARNVGLSRANGEFVTFMDAGDLLETHNLASLVAVSSPDTIVAGGLKDINLEGTVNKNWESLCEVESLGFKRFPAFERRSMFNLVEGKLIPRKILGDTLYNSELASGLDAAPLYEIINRNDVFVVAGHGINESSYLRRTPDAYRRLHQD